MPDELLPTFWTEDERALLGGTTLKPALEAKLARLHSEFANFSTATEGIHWCRDWWLDDVDGFLSFEDWKYLDAIYRTRGLDFPGIGHVMVPCLDMANHASAGAALARFDTDVDGNATLLLEDQKSAKSGQEITIT